MHEEFRQRLVKEYRYAVTKMREATHPAQKLFYFSVFFGEAQRVLNWEWNTDLSLIHMVTQHVHAQINTSMQTPGLVQLLPIATVYEKLTQVASDLTAYLEKTENDDSRKELCEILGRFAEISYAVSGNGSYLLEKGSFKL